MGERQQVHGAIELKTTPEHAVKITVLQHVEPGDEPRSGKEHWHYIQAQCFSANTQI